MYKRIHLIVLLVGLSACVQAADRKPLSAKQRASHQQALFQSFDANSNGKLSEQEFINTIATNLFKDFDLNTDGKVTKAEYMQHAKDKQKAKSEYPKLDLANKGYISINDVLSYSPLVLELKESFKQLDKNNLGFVTLSDLPKHTP